jgi:hypothetical protein
MVYASFTLPYMNQSLKMTEYYTPSIDLGMDYTKLMVTINFSVIQMKKEQ